MAKDVCKACGTELIPGKEFCPNCLVRVPDIPVAAIKTQSPKNIPNLSVPVAGNKKQYPKDTPENRAKKMKEFKVIGMQDVWDLGSDGKFNGKKIEDTLNSYGSDGRSVKEIASRQIPGIASLTYEMVVILERDMPLEP